MPKIPRNVTDVPTGKGTIYRQGKMKMPATKFDRNYYGDRSIREPRIENPFFPQPAKVEEREYRRRRGTR